MSLRKAPIWFVVASILATSVQMALGSVKPLPPRKVISLDGTWQIEQGDMDGAPQTYTHSIVVPGVVDMAQPAFAEAGQKSDLRQAFWYRRTFSVDGTVPEIAVLKIHKARYGTKVFLNGKLVGEHLPCFTPALLNVKPYLKGEGQENELVIRVGADRESIPQDQPTGWDFEKYRFYPGIYDSVELILTGAPYTVNVQTAPNVPAKSVRIVAEIEAADQPCDFTGELEITEAKSGKVVATAKAPAMHLDARQKKNIDVTIALPNCRLWSPEDPFLYNVKLTTGADATQTRFGMRSFHADPAGRRMMLNEKPYYMRGTNVCIDRFNEDVARGDLPWQRDWVRRLHQQIKSMHWNSIRYTIGFPPEFWYDIADEEGLLIQDEFPIWTLSGNPIRPGAPLPSHPKAAKIIPEYIEWMRERWNHPCVVIWDGQNESETPETGKAIQAVRHLDLSNRPWDNGWMEPQEPTDTLESHPYFFIKYTHPKMGKNTFYLRELKDVSKSPELRMKQHGYKNPIIINEYDWLWLNRDGSTTTLTKELYQDHLGPNATAEQRRMLHARYVAALTEFWRCHRKAAAVMHFCSLTYSRDGEKPRPEGGATSDDFVDIAKIEFDPLFVKYVRQAFNPVGLMLDFWDDVVPAGTSQAMNVVVINDLEEPWQGAVKLRVVQGDKEISATSQDCQLDAFGRKTASFTVAIPKQAGRYTLVAELPYKGETVQSLRDINVK